MQFFRINYPYGIVIDLQTKSYALFNRDYMSIGVVATDNNRYKQFSDHFNFLPNDNLTPEFIEYWQMYIKSNKDMALQATSIGDDNKMYHQLWLYNDTTNPCARGYISSKEMELYTNRLRELADKLHVDVSSMIP